MNSNKHLVSFGRFHYLSTNNWFIMKSIKCLFALVCTLVSFGAIAQVTVIPAWFDKTDTITLVYNSSEGNGALNGISPVYAHMGVITSASANASSWLHVQGNWGTADPNVLMTNTLGNIHSKTYHIESFYSIPAGESLQKLAFVFRNLSGNAVGRATDGADIFMDAYSGPFISAITQNGNGPINLNPNGNVEFRGETSERAALQFQLDGSIIASRNSSKFLSATVAGSDLSPGIHSLILQVDTGSGFFPTDSVSINRGFGITPQPVPAGREDGITVLTPNSVHLQLRAPGKPYVFVVGDFNNWQLDSNYLMTPTPDGSTFWIELTGLNHQTRYRYQYHVGADGVRIADPYSTLILDPWNDQYLSQSTFPNRPFYPAGQNFPVGVFQTITPSYEWDSTYTYQRPDTRDLIIYELLLRDFDSQHTWNALINRLDYFDSLNINAIQLMPVMEFEGNQSWGYNPMFMLAADKYYGPENDLKRFVDLCHKRGIAVILDIALNHQFGQSPLARMYWDNTNNQPAADNPWFNTFPKHDFNVGYDMNHESPHTKYFSKRVFKHWLEEYKVDGFRVDMSKGFTQNNTIGNIAAWNAYDQSRVNILNEYGNYVWSITPGAFMILEHFSDNSEETALSGQGFLFWGDMNSSYSDAAMGYSSNLDWGLASNRGWWAKGLVTYMESHDEERLTTRSINFGNSSGGYNVRDTATALRRNGMAAALLFATPGPKMLWQFGELGYDFSINTCGDGSINSNCHLENKPIRWDYPAQSSRRDLFRVYADMIHLHTTEAAFRNDPLEYSMNGLVKTIRLANSFRNFAVIANTDVAPQSRNLYLPFLGTWYSLLDQDSITTNSNNYWITLQPGEFKVFCNDKIEMPSDPFSADLVPDSIALCHLNGDTLMAATGYSEYVWNTGETSSSIVASNTAWYSVIVRNQFGRKAKDSVYVTINCTSIDTASRQIGSVYSAAELKEGYSLSSNGTWTLVGMPGWKGLYSEANDSLDGSLKSEMGGVAVFSNTADGWKEWSLLNAPDREGLNLFGSSIQIKNSKAVVGSPGDKQAAGSAWVMELQAEGNWDFNQKIEAIDAQPGDHFGSSLLLDSAFLLIGSPNNQLNSAGSSALTDAGAIYFYTVLGNAITIDSKWTAQDREQGDLFGEALAGNQDWLFIGAPGQSQNTAGSASLQNAGSVYVYGRSGIAWQFMGQLNANVRSINAEFGKAIAFNGSELVVSAPGVDKAYLFRENGNNWDFVYDIASPCTDCGFGKAMDISDINLVIGAPEEGANGLAYLFQLNGLGASLEKTLVSDGYNSIEKLGSSIEFIDSNTIWVGSPGVSGSISSKGSVLVFKL